MKLDIMDIDMEDIFGKLSMSNYEDHLHDAIYIVSCYNGITEIDKSKLKVVPSQRDYTRIVDILRQYFREIFCYEFLEIMPFIDEYLENTR